MKKITLREAGKLLNITRTGMLHKCKQNRVKHELCACGKSILVDEEEILRLRDDKHKKTAKVTHR